MLHRKDGARRGHGRALAEGVRGASEWTRPPCFFHGYTFCQDERFVDVYILDGRTDRGRRLRLVFQDKGNRLARIFTGWDLKPRKKRKR